MHLSHFTLPRLLAGCLLGASAVGVAARPPARSLLGLAARPAPVREARRVPLSPARGGGHPVVKDDRTLLDEVGRLARAVAPGEAAAWRTELRAGRSNAGRLAWLHLWLGEYELAHDQQPDEAIGHFRQARRRRGASDATAGVAAYDTVLARFYAGEYQEAAAAFHHLLVPRGAMAGYDRRRCALWYRRAAAAAGYHGIHAELGIPEPARLDPLCGVAGLAVCLHELGLPDDRARVAAVCRHTGEGSSLPDLAAACPRLGLVGRPITADEKGLRLLPMPLIAHVEQDHFVAVVRADARGVSYVCSDCGCWPGGRVNLTWKQWRALDPGPYLAVAARGSRTARLLNSLPSAPNQRPAPVRLAAAGGLTHLHLGGVLLNQSLLALLKGHVLLYKAPTGAAGCGLKPTALHCFPWDSCPVDGPCGSSAGPSAGDPVNLATGEEEYQPGPDLTVYNPYGPSIVWGRTYHSLRGPDPDYESDDFGIGWSQPYNVVVKDTSVYSGQGPMATVKCLEFPNGCQLEFSPASVPSVNNQTVPCSLFNPGVPLVIQWVYDPNSVFGDYVVRFGDGTRWIFLTNGAGKSDVPNHTACYQLSRIDNMLIRDPANTSLYGGLTFQYSPSTTRGRSGFQELTAISDATSGSTLLTIDRKGFPGQIDWIRDASGRYVYYASTDHMTVNSPDVPVYLELDSVSQVQPAANPMPPARWSYTYQDYGNGINNGGGMQEVPFLSEISVPSPSGTGMQNAFINYDPATAFVLNTEDANGTYRTYTQEAPLQNGGQVTQVQISKYAMPTAQQVLFAYSVECDPNLERTLITDGTNNVNATTGVTKIAYGSANAPYRPSSITDGNGKERDFQWDQFGNLTYATSPHTMGNPSVVTNCNWEKTADFPVGRLTTVQEVSRLNVPKTTATLLYNETSTSVDYGRLIEIDTPTPGTIGGLTVKTTYTYDALGNTLALTQPGVTANVTTTFSYLTDQNAGGSIFMQPGGWPRIGEPLSATDAAGGVTHFRYDARGELVSARDALNNTATALFNVAGQPLVLSLPATLERGCQSDTTVLTYQYPGGPLIKSQLYDETGTGTPVRTVNYAYGNEGEFLSRTGDTEAVTQTYDPMMRLSTVTDGRGQKTTFVYQQAGEPGYLSQIRYPNYASNTSDTGTFPDAFYDGDGRPTERKDGNGVVTTYSYGDDTGALTGITYPVVNMQPNPSNVTLSYDGFGRPMTMTDGAGSQTYAYDDLNNVTSVMTSYKAVGTGSAPPTQTFTYAYNPNGSRQSLAISPAIGSHTFQYSYDSVGRMSGLTNPDSQVSQWSYLPNNWLQSQTLGNNVYTAYQYNPIGDLKELTNYQTQGGAVLTDFGGYNSVKHDGPGNTLAYTATMPQYGGQTSYQYDNKEQLAQEKSNRLSGGGVNYNTLGYSYDPAGNLTSYLGNTSQNYNADNQDTSATLDDNNGSPFYRQSQALRYDPENRLTSVGPNWTYGYTGDGQRAWKANNNVPTFFYYDGAVPVLETDQMGNVQALNTYGPNGLLSRRTSSGTTYYTFDSQGSVAQRLNSSGGVIDSHLFYAFGHELTQPVSVGDPFAFGAQWGYYTDQASSSDTGLVLCGWRYYDPNTGRFLTRDPLGYAGGLNLYAFAANNPVSYADPSGTNPILCAGIGAGIGAIFNGTMAYVHHQNVWRAVVRGATVGGVTGFFTCLDMPELGVGFLGAAARGLVGRPVGETKTHLAAIDSGRHCRFKRPNFVSADPRLTRFRASRPGCVTPALAQRAPEPKPSVSSAHPALPAASRMPSQNAVSVPPCSFAPLTIRKGSEIA